MYRSTHLDADLPGVQSNVLKALIDVIPMSKNDIPVHQGEHKIASVFLVIVLILSSSSGLIPTVQSKGDQEEDPLYPREGDWVITNTTILRNETIILNGNLTIAPGGNLTLVNTTLILNCTYDGQYHIDIEDGGELHVIGTKGVIPGGGTALWHMDEGAGDTIHDASENHMDGTIYGATWADGKFGSALEFDGVDDYVDCGDDPVFDMTDAITLEAWVNYTELTSFPRAISRQYSGGTTADSCYQLGMTNNRARFALGGIFDHSSSGPTITTGRWYHIVGTYDRETARLYLDGDEIWSDSYSAEIRTSDQPLTLGISVYEGSTFYPHEGLIDEVSIYNRALTGDEVLDHYEGRRSAHPVPAGNDDNRNSPVLHFDGNDDNVEVAGLNCPSSFTYECWVKNAKTTFPGYTTIIEFGNDAPYFGLLSGKPGLYQGATASDVIGTDWTHIAVTYDGSSRISKVYVDGDQSGTRTNNVNAGGSGMGIGYHSGDGHFEGAIDEVRILNRVLNATEIAEDYNAADHYPVRSGTVGWWYFDEDEGTTVEDTSGNNHPGTIHGATWEEGGGDDNETEPTGDWITSITASGHYNFGFHAHSGSVLELRNMIVSHCGSAIPGSEGMRIDSVNTTIVGNLFRDSLDAIILNGTSEAMIVNNSFLNNSAGIMVQSGTGLHMEGNQFSKNGRNVILGNTTDSILLGSVIRNGGSGIEIDGGSDLTLTDTEFTNLSSGITMKNVTNTVVARNLLENCGHGVLIENSRTINLTGNSLFQCGVQILGVEMADFDSHIISNNTVNDGPLYYLVGEEDTAVPEDAGGIIMVKCSGIEVARIDISSADLGVEMAYVNDSRIIGSTIEDCAYGVFLYASHGNIITENDLTGNAVGVSVQGMSSDNEIHFNDISGNELSGLDASENGGSSIEAERNFWGSPSGPFNPTTNPGGNGDNVTDDVVFVPWTRAAPGENVWFVDASSPEGGNGTPSEPFTSISSAVENASQGETINVLPGTYAENILIERNMVISGRGGHAILDADGGTGFDIRAPAVITNFTITNAASDLLLSENASAYDTIFSQADFLGGYDLSVGYFLDIRTYDMRGDELQGAEIIIEDNASMRRAVVSDEDGSVLAIPLVKYIMNATSTRELNPFSINASYEAGYDNATLVLDSNAEVTLNLTRHGALGTGAAYGDLDGDELIDYAVGAPFDSTGGWNSGAVFIFSGTSVSGRKELMTDTVDGLIQGASSMDLFGTSLAIDDINQDGMNDLIVTAPSVHGQDGTVFLFSGEVLRTGQVGIDDAIPLMNGIEGLGTTLTTADVNGDPYPDILTETADGITIFFGESGTMTALDHTTIYGLSRPVVINATGGPMLAAVAGGEVIVFSPGSEDRLESSFSDREDFNGTFNHTLFDGGLTISPYEAILANGDFDDGWQKWTRKVSIRDANDGHWELTTEEHGDWVVYDGPTAGLGPEGGHDVKHTNDQGRTCDGKLVSEPFLVDPDMEYLDLWHHVKWWNFEQANEGQFQDDIEDFISLRIVYDDNGTVVGERVYNQTTYGYDGEEEGRLRFDISPYRGETLRLEIELSNNRPQSEDGLVQVDNISGIRKDPVMKGDFISDILDLTMSVSSFIPHWKGVLNRGSITLEYRANESENWTPMMNHHIMDLSSSSSSTIQYRVLMEGISSEPYPVLTELHFTFFPQSPENLGGGVCYYGGSITGNDTLVIVNGTRAAIYNESSITITITSDEEIDDLSSIGDVDGDGTDDLLVSSDNTVYILPVKLSSGDVDLDESPYSFSGPEGFGTLLRRNLVGSPTERRGDGMAYLLPTHLNDTSILGVNLLNHSLVYPDSEISLNLSLQNIGYHDMGSINVVMNITGEDGFSLE